MSLFWHSLSLPHELFYSFKSYSLNPLVDIFVSITMVCVVFYLVLKAKEGNLLVNLIEFPRKFKLAKSNLKESSIHSI